MVLALLLTISKGWNTQGFIMLPTPSSCSRQICTVEGIEEISEFDLAFVERSLQPCRLKSAVYSLQGFLGAGVFAGQG
jgi:uncharacterized membrane protein YhiD involved in acid resistance